MTLPSSLDAYNQPVGFAYEEPGHLPFYQVRMPGHDRPVIQTTEVAQLRTGIQAMGQEVVWLSRQQISALNIPIGGKYMRPVTQDERGAV